MPCTDGGVPYPPSEEELLGRKTEAMLCVIWGTLTPHQQSNVIAKADWREAGVTYEEFTRWWQLHQKQDERRRAHERERAKMLERRTAALAKLTPEERAALGV